MDSYSDGIRMGKMNNLKEPARFTNLRGRAHLQVKVSAFLVDDSP